MNREPGLDNNEKSEINNRASIGDLRRQQHIEMGGESLISEAAYNQFVRWGVSESEIQELAQVVTAYEYTKCSQKLDRISDVDLVVEGSGASFIVMHNFYNFDGGKLGQCGDISFKLSKELKELGLLRGNGLQSISLQAEWGNCPHFFASDGTQHVWNVATDGRNPELDLVIDGALRRVIVRGESGYKTHVIQSSAQLQDFKPTNTSYVRVSPLMQPTLSSNPSFTDLGHEIVGLTEDRNFAVGVGFSRYMGQIVPFVKLVHPNGDDYIYLFDSPTDGSEQLYSSNSIMKNLASHNLNEVRNLRKILSTKLKSMR